MNSFSFLLNIGITLLFVLPLLASVGLLLWRLYKNATTRRRLLTTGMRAPARIVQVAQTGVQVNQQPEVRIDLEVHPPGSHPYVASATQVLSLLNIARAQPGASVWVRFDPHQPAQVAVEGL